MYCAYCDKIRKENFRLRLLNQITIEIYERNTEKKVQRGRIWVEEIDFISHQTYCYSGQTDLITRIMASRVQQKLLFLQKQYIIYNILGKIFGKKYYDTVK